MVIYSVEYVCSYATTLSVICMQLCNYTISHMYAVMQLHYQSYSKPLCYINIWGGWGSKVSIMTYSDV